MTPTSSDTSAPAPSGLRHTLKRVLALGLAWLQLAGPVLAPMGPHVARLAVRGAVAMSAGLMLETHPAHAASNLPALGDTASDDLTVAAEKRLGDRIMQEIRRDPDVIDDPLLFDYVQQTFAPLIASARQRGEISEDLQGHFEFRTFLVRDRTVNAFALPGGNIGVHLGLIAMTASRDELAAVLAHELSHVTQRHIARNIAVNRRQSLVGVAALILGVMAASRSPDQANALIMGGQGVAAQGQLNFSRDMEREADRVGFGVLAGAGYAPVAMVGMFERLQAASRLDSQQFPYLRTHPLTGERIGEARQRLGVGGADLTLDMVSGGEDSRWLHAAMQGRARALMDGRSETLQRLAAGATLAASPAPAAAAGLLKVVDGGVAAPAVPGQPAPDSLATAYAAALAATRLKDWSRADQALRRGLALSAPHPTADQAMQALVVESLAARGRVPEALEVLHAHVDGRSRAGLLLAASVVLAATGPQAAPVTEVGRSSQSLQTWVALHPDDATAWDLLGQLLERAGQPLAALRAQAEVQVAYGNLQGAADRLRAGQRLARSSGQGDSVDAAVIDARLTAVELRRRREMAEERNNGQL